MNLLIDIDHTLTIAGWRDKWMGNWDVYHSKSLMDEPLIETVAMVRALYQLGWHIILLTARPGKWREMTKQWMELHNVPYDELLMRPDDNLRSSVDLKKELVLERFKDFKSFPKGVMAIDDHPEVVKMFDEMGMTVLHVHSRAGKPYHG